jgi:hypothetical protein
MNFKKWLQQEKRGKISKMAQDDKFPERGGFLSYSDYVKRYAPGQWQNTLKAWLDYQSEKRDE